MAALLQELLLEFFAEAQVSVGCILLYFQGLGSECGVLLFQLEYGPCQLSESPLGLLQLCGGDFTLPTQLCDGLVAVIL